MAYGLSYMPNFSGVGSGFKQAGEAIGKYFEEKGDRIGKSQKYRSWIKAQMPKDKDEALAFQDRFMGGKEVDDLGLNELEAVEVALAAAKVQDSQNLVGDIVKGLTDAEESRANQAASLADPNNNESYRNLSLDQTALRERLSRAAGDNPHDPQDVALHKAGLQRERAELKALTDAYGAGNDGAAAYHPTGLGDFYDGQAQAPRVEMAERENRKNLLRIKEIDAALSADVGSIKSDLHLIGIHKDEIRRRLGEQSAEVAKAPLNLAGILSQATSNNPYASPSAVMNGLNMVGVLQQQRFNNETYDARVSQVNSGARAADAAADSAETKATYDENTLSARTRQAELAATKLAQDIQAGEAELSDLSSAFTKEQVAAMGNGDLSIIAGMSPGQQGQALKVIHAHVSVQNLQLQQQLAAMRSLASTEGGLKSHHVTMLRSLVEDASGRMEGLERQIETAGYQILANPKLKSQLQPDIDKWKKQIEQYQKDVDKYRGLLDEDIERVKKSKFSGLQEGQEIIQNGVRFRVTNGKPVPVK